MIVVVKKDMSIELQEECNFSSLGIWERRDLQEWILEHPEILGEELLVITSEFAGFDKTKKRLDVLAVDRQGKLVVIELKRDVASKLVDLQAIHYAAYCSNLDMDRVVNMMVEFREKKTGGSKPISRQEIEVELRSFIQTDFEDFDNRPRIMLVANDFRGETLSAVLWLRGFGLDITCVKLTAYKIGDDIIVKPSILIPLPEAKDFVIDVETKSRKNSELSEKKRGYYGFWSKLLKAYTWPTNRQPSTGPVQTISAGYTGAEFKWFFKNKPDDTLGPGFYTALCFDFQSQEKNSALLEYFRSKHNQIERAMENEEVVFEGGCWGKQSCIYVKRDSTALDRQNLEWGMEQMILFLEHLKPLLDEYMKGSQDRRNFSS